jgi:hypothetical protein
MTLSKGSIPPPVPTPALQCRLPDLRHPFVDAGNPGQPRRCASGGRWPGKPRPANRTRRWTNRAACDGRLATAPRHRMPALSGVDGLSCPQTAWRAGRRNRKPSLSSRDCEPIRRSRCHARHREPPRRCTRGRRAVVRSRERCSGRSAITRCQNQQPQAADYRVIGTRWEPGCGGRSLRSDAAFLQGLAR